MIAVLTHPLRYHSMSCFGLPPAPPDLCQVRNRSDIFGFVDSGIVDRPFAFLILTIDLDETPIPLNLFEIVVPEALDWSNNNGIDANNGRDDADVLLLKIFRSHLEKRTCFINPVPHR